MCTLKVYHRAEKTTPIRYFTTKDKTDKKDSTSNHTLAREYERRPAMKLTDYANQTAKDFVLSMAAEYYLSLCYCSNVGDRVAFSFVFKG